MPATAAPPASIPPARPSRRTRRVPIAAGVLLTIAAAWITASATGGPRLSAADEAFARDAGAICHAAHRQLSQAPALAGPAGIREGAPQVLATTAQTISRLEHLTPTPRFRTAHRAYLGALHRQKELVGLLRHAGAVGDAALARRVSALLSENSVDAGRAGAELADAGCGRRSSGDPDAEPGDQVRV